MSTTTSRRNLLVGAAGTLGALAVGGCSTSTPAPRQQATNSAALPPTHVPFAGVKPDKPGNSDGVPPGFYDYPATPIKRDGHPMTGIAPFTALVQGIPPRVSPKENQCYAQMERSLGTSFSLTFGPFANYVEKFQVTMAGGDIPDLAMIVNVAQLPKLLEMHFTDLTDVLAGDNIKKYPGPGQHPLRLLEDPYAQRPHLGHPPAATTSRPGPHLTRRRDGQSGGQRSQCEAA